jgi:hypothetical protein
MSSEFLMKDGMKKYYVMVFCLMGRGLMASEPQKHEQPPLVTVNGLRQSTDAIAIPGAAKRVLEQKEEGKKPAIKIEDERRSPGNSPSSGSNSLGISPDLFPGQTGLGSYSPSTQRRELAPINARDTHWGYY